MPLGLPARYSDAMDWLFLRCIFLIAASLGIASLRGAEDIDKETEKALKAAEESAKSMGLNMPDLKALMEDDKKEESAAKPANASPTPNAAKTSGSIALPAWTPQTPQFTPDGPVAKKSVEGKEKIVLSGTSPLSPVALADEWEKSKNDRFSLGRLNSNVNNTITQTVTYRELEGDGEVELSAVRTPRDKVTRVVISSPLPKATGD